MTHQVEGLRKGVRLEFWVKKGREVVDLPRALSEKVRKESVRNRHRGRKADGGEGLSMNLIAKSLSLRGVEEPGKDLGEKRILSWEPLEM